jgi:hypothetical protein
MAALVRFRQRSNAEPINAAARTEHAHMPARDDLRAGLSFPSLMTLAVSGASRNDAGLASGLVNTTLQVGGALRLPVFATLATTRAECLRAGDDGTAAALTGGYHLAFAVGNGLVVAGIVVALTLLRPERLGAHEEDVEAGLARAEPAYS